LKYKLKQLVYLKETVTDWRGSQDLFIPARVISVSRDPNYVFVQSIGQHFIFEHGNYMVQEDPEKSGGFRKIKVNIERVFTKEEVDLLYG